MMRSRHLAIVAVSVAATASAGWATVWRDRLPEPAPVPPIELASDGNGSEWGQNAKDLERRDEKDGGETSGASGTSVGGGEWSGAAGDSVGGAAPPPVTRPLAADDDGDDDDRDDDDA